MSDNQASLLLKKQLRDLLRHPVDGFSAGLVDDSNIFEWTVTIIGPPDTLYEGGFFNAIMSFPSNYPNSPPSVRFTSEMWHPNVYPDGRVCVSILHAPGDDPNGYELASERWSPVHTVETILLSIISMLSSPNDESPANIDAAGLLPKARHEGESEIYGTVGRLSHCQRATTTTSLVLRSLLLLRLQWQMMMMMRTNLSLSRGGLSPGLGEAIQIHGPTHIVLKDWRESREDFKRKVGRIVRKSQEGF